MSRGESVTERPEQGQLHFRFGCLRETGSFNLDKKVLRLVLDQIEGSEALPASFVD